MCIHGRVCSLTFTLSRLPRASIFMHTNQLYSLLFHQSICYNHRQLSSSIQQRTKANVPASLDIPSLPARTHEVLHIPHTSLSFPSFTHPHLAAATASIAGGLFAYVVSLYVARRRRNELVDDGRYSDVKSSDLAIVEDGIDDLNGFAWRARVAVRDRIATRWGALLERLCRRDSGVDLKTVG